MNRSTVLTCVTLIALCRPCRGRDGAGRREPDSKKYTETITTKDGSKLSFDMVLIPGGTFTMGSPAGEADRADHEGPQRQVQVNPFYLCTTETTIELFLAYYQETGTAKKDFLETEAAQKKEETKARRQRHHRPDPRLRRHDHGLQQEASGHRRDLAQCDDVLPLALAEDGQAVPPADGGRVGVRRPGRRSSSAFGVCDSAEGLKDYAWFGENANMEPHAVATKKPNAWGLYDMHGNVREWVQDFYSPTGYGLAFKDNPAGPKEGKVHVARGGFYDSPAGELRCAARAFEEDWWRMNDPQIPKSKWWLPQIDSIGFRVACEVPTERRSSSRHGSRCQDRLAMECSMMIGWPRQWFRLCRGHSLYRHNRPVMGVNSMKTRRIPMWLSITAVIALEPARQRVQSPMTSLTFKPDDKGGYTFDTGDLRGTLRQDGKSRGLSSVVHIPSGTRLDGSVGIAGHYRVFTTNKRYGTAAWDWPGTAELLPDGSVRTTWPAAEDRPFEMTALYRWADPQTLDVETTVTARADLSGFESFFASYFDKAFPSPYVLADSEGPKILWFFLLGEKSHGDWLMFLDRGDPRIDMVRDGRWLLEPNPGELDDPAPAGCSAVFSSRRRPQADGHRDGPATKTVSRSPCPTKASRIIRSICPSSAAISRPANPPRPARGSPSQRALSDGRVDHLYGQYLTQLRHAK